MKRYLTPLILLCLFPLSLLLIFMAKSNPTTLTALYSERFNQWVVEKLSQLTGILPFSLFEWLIYFLILMILGYFGLTLYQVAKYPKTWWSIIGRFFLHLLSFASLLYFLFTILWGLNYYKTPLEETLQLNLSPRSVEELALLYDYLINQTNETRTQVFENEDGIFTINETVSEIFKRAPLGYAAAATTYPFLGGDYGLPKAVFLSDLMSYTNITGIYSPFTAEANVNVSVPKSTLLFTTMHEMAHQRGFASENEANFIAYLTCIAHPDVDFQYSGYLNALSYVNRALALVDRETLITLNEKLSDGVRRDLNDQRDYWKQYEGKVEETFIQMNQTYLKLNGVNDGVQSYGRVVDLLLAYYEPIN